MKRVVFIYPYLTSYILPVLLGMAESGQVSIDVVYGPIPSGMGFENQPHPEHPNLSWIQVQEFRPFGNRFSMYQKGVINHILKTRPDSIIIWANPRFISFWGVLIVGKILNIPVFSRGHGIFKKKRVGILNKMMYKLILTLSHRYICYTPEVKTSLTPLVKNLDKLVVDYNTLYNDYPVKPTEKTGLEKGIFYIGRVRGGCGVDILIQAVDQLNQKEDLNIDLHIIGDGPFGGFLQDQAAKFHWLTYHGKIFDQKKISDISRQCRLGCVPGFMGLNVVHMLSLSLPVVTHAQLDKHMGPEPEYVQHEQNGWLLNNPNDLPALTEALRQLWLLPNDKFRVFQENSYKTFLALSNPPFHERLLKILEE